MGLQLIFTHTLFLIPRNKNYFIFSLKRSFSILYIIEALGWYSPKDFKLDIMIPVAVR